MLIRELIGLPVTFGEVGIEIEVEGTSLPDDEPTRTYTKAWKADHDGSLKAEEAYEYVLISPCYYGDVNEHLDDLWNLFREMDSEIFESPKAGVHVHLNVQRFTVNQLASLAVLWFIFENPLVKYCGSNREGNLFCLRASDAVEMIDNLVRIIRTKKFNNFNNDEYRYSSLNFKSVTDYGSVEFRTMRSTGDKQAISTWIDILYELYEAAKLFNDPREIISAISGDGYEQFMKKIFKKTYNHIPNYPTISQDIYDGICNAQDIAYCVNWDKYTPKRSNPFA